MAVTDMFLGLAPYDHNGTIPLPNAVYGGLQRIPEPRGSFPASNHVAAALDAEEDRRTQVAVAAWIQNMRPVGRANARVWCAAAPNVWSDVEMEQGMMLKEAP